MEKTANKGLEETPIVSVVTPSFNQGRFIGETIESVISQEGDFCLEYLIMDGGSTDNSVEVIKRYEALLKEGKWPVKCRGIEYGWVSEKDRGQTDAINKGFRRAKGEIVAWLNADDTYLPGTIEKAVKHFTSNPACMTLYGEGYEMDETGTVIRRFKATRDFDLPSLIHVCDYILQPTVFMRKKALEEAGFPDEGLNWCMDWDLWIRIGKRFRVDYIPEYLASSRIYKETKTSTGGIDRFREIISVMKRHGNRRLPPGDFLYGFDCLLYILSRKMPSLYGFLKRFKRGPYTAAF